MKRGLALLPIIVLPLLVLIYPQKSLAHPGRTASDGCHYCRTRCDYWGVRWNERHCHGGGVIKIATPKPSPIPTPKPTPIPSPTPLILGGDASQKEGVNLTDLALLVLALLAVPYLFIKFLKTYFREK